MNNKFDLERFKAGEPATDEKGYECGYIGELPDGHMFVWIKKGGWNSSGSYIIIGMEVYKILPAWPKAKWTMKPKEEWCVVNKQDAFSTKRDAEDFISKMGLTGWQAVKIIRE